MKSKARPPMAMHLRYPQSKKQVDPSYFLLAIGCLAFVAMLLLAAKAATADEHPPGEGPALGERLTQERIESGELSLLELRREGRRIFSTPFNRLDGYGDGPMDPSDPLEPGNRPTLQNNGMTLRVNGLDAQSCLECHGVVSNLTIPARFGVGGVGGIGANVLAGPSDIDVDDSDGNGFANFDGRYINPPFVFGSGGVELLGKEMTRTLQRLKEEARQNPGSDVPLVAKGVSFGTILFQNGQFDTSRVEGVDDDLVVRPFGRKGEFTSVRDFAIGAMQFHFGMQPSEIVGDGIDDDGDGTADEILVGELSAVHVFGTTTERPRRRGATPESRTGFETFQAIGCAECHTPFLTTHSKELTYSFPEVATDPDANVYMSVDLTATPMGFREHPGRDGIVVPLFADLKRHDMGDRLAEGTDDELAREFTTARLWGVADTAPYLHDGRALTLTDAILAHGGEAQRSRDAFEAIPDSEKVLLLGFLRSLRTPLDPAGDL